MPAHPENVDARKNGATISSEVTNTPPLIDPKIEQPAKLKEVIDTKLKPLIDTDNPDNLDSPYKSTKKVVLDAYNS